jgi:splicing factor 3B subunit 2
MGLSTAERNRRKRERRKREREQQQQGAELPFGSPNNDKRNDEDNEQEGEEIEVEYVAEPLRLPEDDQNFAEVVKAQRRAVAGIVGVVVSSDEDDNADIRNKDGDHRGGKDAGRMSEQEDVGDEDDDEEDGEDGRRRGALSKRKLREILRPTVAELKRRVKRPDLVEAHDVTAPDPDFLIELKSVEGTVPVPRHWGRKRKYLQGKRGFEKPPFQLPDFIVRTGIAEVRDAAAQQDSEMSAKQRNRMRVAPKMGAIDVDYKVLYA